MLGREGGIGAKRQHDTILAGLGHRDEGMAGGDIVEDDDTGHIDAGRRQGRHHQLAGLVAADPANKDGRGAGARGSGGLVAALAARQPHQARPSHRLAGLRQMGDAADDVEVQGTDDADTHDTPLSQGLRLSRATHAIGPRLPLRRDPKAAAHGNEALVIRAENLPCT